MLFVQCTSQRRVLALLIGLSIFLSVKWARRTTPEVAEPLAILPGFAEDPGRPHFPPLKEGCSSETTNGDNLCAAVDGGQTPTVQIVLKTGAGDHVKTEKALSTYLSCDPGVLVFSDTEDNLQGHAVIDILADLPASYATDNPDWQNYKAQKESVLEGDDVHKTREGWRLDRFKFLPMVEKAFEMNPDADWYFFMEADMYFFWDTLHRLVGKLDATERHFLGAAVPGANHTFFGYGGAGLILSGRLMHDLLDDRTERLSANYEQRVRRDCCGDAVLAYILYEELGVRIQNAYPTMSGEALDALGVKEETWCTPLLSLHRTPPDLMERLWKWERCRPYDESPIYLSTLLDFTLAPILETGTILSNWDNFSGREPHFWNRRAHRSIDACARHCASDQSCLQWSFSPGRCRTAPKIKQGHGVEHDVTSGWDLSKLQLPGYQGDGSWSEVCSRRRSVQGNEWNVSEQGARESALRAAI